MKVFLSWSGELSLKVANAFRDWLPSVIQSILPYVSAEDIDKGSRWSSDIAKELEESTYGILCITKSNLNAPWINFEAGALSKTIEKSNVSPFLFNIKRSEVQGPLLQFQSTIYEEDELLRLMFSINNRVEEREKLDEVRLRRAFDVWWPQLKDQLDKLLNEQPFAVETKQETSDHQDQILEELLELARNQHKLLRSPDVLLPREYLDQVFNTIPIISGESVQSMKADLERLHRRLIKVEETYIQVREADPENPIIKLLGDKIYELHTQMHKIMGKKAVVRKKY